MAPRYSIRSHARPFAFAITVTFLAVTALAGTSFSETGDPAGDRRTTAAELAEQRRTAALVAAIEGAHEAADRAEVTRYVNGVKAAAAEAARRERAEVLARRRAARAAAPRGATGNWAELINQYPWPAQTAYRIMMCESGGDPNAYNPRSGATGLFQILNGPRDAAANVAMAFRMWQSRGWQPWRACL